MSHFPNLATDAAKAADFNQLGEILAAALSPVVSFDRFNIGLIDEAAYVFIDAYVSGTNVAGRAIGHERTLHGTVVEAAIANDDGLWMGDSDVAALIARFPRFGPVAESGMRAMLAAPLRVDGGVAASLVLASSQADAFDDRALALVKEAGQTVLSKIIALKPR